jgi:electron transfer flavoprotein beta subunit
MNIVVCLKQVPGTTEVKIDPQTNTLIRQGIENVINPFDTYAIEEAVRPQGKAQGAKKGYRRDDGPHRRANAALREAVSLGADAAVLLSDRAFAGADTWATAYTLSRAVAKIQDYDLVICGRQTIDGDTGQVGPEMAEMLDVPFIAYVSNIEEIKDKYLRVRRMIEEGHEVIETTLPAVITVAKEINVPRLPSLRGIMKSKSARIETGAPPSWAPIPIKWGWPDLRPRLSKYFSAAGAPGRDAGGGNGAAGGGAGRPLKKAGLC